jgi:signal transduction histidine kinase
LKEALRSKYVLSGWLLLVISIPGTITIPLTEARGSVENFLLLFAISIITMALALGFMFGFRPLYQRGRAPWWLSIVLAGTAGALKSGTTWIWVDYLGLEQPELWSRLLAGALSWGIVYPAVVIIGHSLLRLRDENRELRTNLLEARNSFSQLDQQLNWLIQTRVQGLSDELAKRFVGLVSKLNSQGAGPGAYRDIAAELRSAALKQVRSRSAEVWSARTKPTLKELVSDFGTTAANPLLTVALFFSSAAINNLRIFGIGLEAASVVVSSGVLFMWLWAARTKPALQHFAGPLASIALLLFLLALDFEPFAALSGAIATLIWVHAVILFSISWSLALGLARKEREALKTAATTTEADSQWLAIQLESTNLEIAKYLHAILQTRLMAYAMKLDSGDVPSQSDLDDLKALLMKPMGEFGQQSKDLGQGLSELKQNWGVLVEVSVEVDADEKTLVEPTLQVVREAVANSIKHGLADHVEVEIRDHDNLRRVVVLDNGIGPRTGSAGLGTKVFTSLTKEHSLSRNENGGSTFVATLEL